MWLRHNEQEIKQQEIKVGEVVSWNKEFILQPDAIQSTDTLSVKQINSMKIEQKCILKMSHPQLCWDWFGEGQTCKQENRLKVYHDG